MNVLHNPTSGVSAPPYPTPAKAVVFQTPATRDKIGESDSRILADCRHDRQVLRNMMVSALMFVVTILAAIFATVLELPVFWRNFWLAICITFAVVTFFGVFYLEQNPTDQRLKSRR
jgi:membrane protein insertase Oxa1/YidC/SpoIIIJ